MTASRLQGRRGDGSAVVRGWVAVYTLGLAQGVARRRRDEVAGDLADETLDAVRRGETADLRRRRLLRWVLGIPDDLVWRLTVAPTLSREASAGPTVESWVPVSRMALVLLGISAIGTAGALTLVAQDLVRSPTGTETWAGWGPYGFVIACTLVLIAVVLAVPWPRRGLGIGALGVALGMTAAPWLWGCWFLVLFALAVRWYQARGSGDWTGPA